MGKLYFLKRPTMKNCLIPLFLLFVANTCVKGQEVDSIINSYKEKGILIELPKPFAAKKDATNWADLMIEANAFELMYTTRDYYHNQQANDSVDNNNNATFYWGLSMVTVKNLAKDEMSHLPKVFPLPAKALANDFNADLGFIYLFKPKDSFTEHKHAFILGLHKKWHPDIYVVILGDDPEELKKSFPSLILGKVKYNATSE